MVDLRKLVIDSVDPTVDSKVDKVMSYIKSNFKLDCFTNGASYYKYEDKFITLSIVDDSAYIPVTTDISSNNGELSDKKENKEEKLELNIFNVPIRCSNDMKKRVLDDFQKLYESAYIKNSNSTIDMVVEKIEEFNKFQEFKDANYLD